MVVSEATIEGYLRVLPSEVRPENLVRQGTALLLTLEIDGLVVRARRLCTVGRVQRIEERRSFIDLVLSLDEGEVTVRVWEDSGVSLEGVSEGSVVLACGTLREYADNVYISTVLVRKVGEEYVEVFKRQLKADRALLRTRAK